jgi:hypothetical protein
VTFVVERTAETDTGSVEIDVEYRSDRLLVCLSGRTISFSLNRGRQLARLSDDTHQSELSPTDIPDSVLEHVLAGGWRLEGSAGERDGEFVLLTQ